MKSKQLATNCQICSGKVSILVDDLYDDRYGAPGRHAVSQCTQCDYAQTQPGLMRRDIGRFYTKYYPHSQADPSVISNNPHPPSKLIAWILGLGHTCHWATKEGESVLDIGSGTGRSLIEIRALGGNPYGVEPDPSVQSIAKQLKLKVYKGFISDNPFPKKKFDLITASQVIEHEPDPKKFLHAAKSKLKPGGRIILSTPNLNSLGRYLYGRRWINWHIPYHLSFFTNNTFHALASGAGLRVVNSKTVTPTLWTVLQWQALSQTSVEGQSSHFWSSQATPKRFDYLKMILLYLVAFPYSRIVDLLGLGESLVITMEHNEQF